MDEPGEVIATSSSSDAAPPNRGAAAAMTALAVAYPLVTTWYFWADWFRFLDFGGPVSTSPAGLLIPFGEMGYATLLSPWRLVAAGISAALLGSSARRLWRRSPSAPAFTLLTIWGVILPQVFWYTEFVFDWKAGRGLGTVMLAALATAAVPTALLLRKGGAQIRGWGKLAFGRGRLLAGTAGLGWAALAATTFLDHSDQFRNAGLSFAAALATLPLAALGMIGLWKQRTWGLMAATSAIGALGAMVFGLSDASFAPMGRAIDTVTGAVSATWAHTAAGMVVPFAIFTALLAPFVTGLARRLAGAPLEPAHVASGASTSWAASGARIAAEPRAQTTSSPVVEAHRDAEAEALATAEADEYVDPTRGHTHIA